MANMSTVMGIVFRYPGLFQRNTDLSTDDESSC